MLLQVCNPIIMKQVYTQQVCILSILEIWVFILFFSILLLLRCDITADILYYVNRELLQVGITQKCFISLRHRGDGSTKNKHCLKRDEWKSEHGILQATADKITQSWIKILRKEYSLSFFQQAFDMQVSQNWSHSSMSQEHPTLPLTNWDSFNRLPHTVDIIVLDSKSTCCGSPRSCSILRLQGLPQYNHDKSSK